MSKQLLIMGNGFDLHCGLKTSYKDFFRNTILDTIGERYYIQQIRAGVSGFWEHLLVEYYKVFGRDDYSWCDIESIIRNVLCGIFNTGSSNLNLEKDILYAVRNNIDLYEQKIYGDNKPIERYILIYCVNVLYKVKFDIESDNDRLNYLGRKLLDELNNFERRFCKYIHDCIFDEVNNLNEKYIVNAVNLLAYITGFSTSDFENVDDIFDIEEEYDEEEISTNVFNPILREYKVISQVFNSLITTNILSFNYTSLFDILGVKSPCAYSNVHGKLCNKQCSKECTASSVIFGIDDSLIQAQDTNSVLRLFSKTYRKMYDTSTPVSALPQQNSQSIEIKFYGHSLSEADYSYFQSIFDFYNIYGNINVSLIFYYSKGYEQNDAIYRLINSYGKTLENKDQGKNLIHKLLLENRLKIVEVPDNI